MEFLELILRHWVAVLVLGAVALPLLGAFLTKGAQMALGAWREARESEQHARADEQLLALKHSMVERGMSADKIERVLKAGRE